MQNLSILSSERVTRTNPIGVAFFYCERPGFRVRAKGVY